MGQDSESIVLQSDDAVDLKIVSSGAPQSETAGTASFATGEGVSIDTSSADLELQLSPVRKPKLKQDSPIEGTSVVDLGEDLLEKTAVFVRATEGKPSPLEAETIAELHAEPRSPTFDEDEASPSTSLNGSPVASESSISPVSFAQTGMEPQAGDSSISPVPRFAFEHELEEPEFLRSNDRHRELASLWADLAHEFELDEPFKVDLKILGSSESDRVDLGIAFMEMGLFDLALREFASERCREPSRGMAVVPLEAQVLLTLNRPFQALDLIESVAGDPDLDGMTQGPLRAELQYWAARCCEALGRDGEAVVWLRLVAESVPGYRDVEQRLRSLLRGRS